MTKVTSSNNAFDSNVTEIMTEARQPVFVDNAVHHALLSSQAANKHKVTIENRNNASYSLFTEKTYEMVEGESYIQLTHSRTPGHSSKSAPFYQDESLSSTSKKPMLIYSAQDNNDRLTISSIEASNDGVKANIKNMKGRSLKDIGFNTESVRMGDPIDVGLRTSDLAMRLGTDVTGTLTSVNLGGLRNSTNTNDNRRKHTTKFLAEDFYGTNLISALKFVSRHDSNVVQVDRFANLLYIPFTFSTSGKSLSPMTRSGKESSNPIEHNENRITIEGMPMSLNETARITMDDAERQQGKFDLDMQETIRPIFDATVKSNSAAKRVARQILKANSIYKGAMQSNGHLNSWELRPGGIVEYGGTKRLITQSKHRLSNRMSDFNFLSVQKGIEGVLQEIGSGMVAASTVKNSDSISQTTEVNLSLFNSIQILSIPIISVRTVETTKFLIGSAASRAKIGKANGKAIGSDKMHGVTIRGGV